MKNQTAKTIFLKDYEPPQFLIDKVDLQIDLFEEWTSVKSTMELRRNPNLKQKSNSLVLSGQNLELKNIFLDNIELKKKQYEIDDSHLKIINVPNKFVLITKVRIKPHKNTELEGLYNLKVSVKLLFI